MCARLCALVYAWCVCVCVHELAHMPSTHTDAMHVGATKVSGLESQPLCMPNDMPLGRPARTNLFYLNNREKK